MKSGWRSALALVLVPVACTEHGGGETAGVHVAPVRLPIEPWPPRGAVLAAIRAAVDERPGVSSAVHYLRLHDVLPSDDERIERASARTARPGSTTCPMAMAPTRVNHFARS